MRVSKTRELQAILAGTALLFAGCEPEPATLSAGEAAWGDGHATLAIRHLAKADRTAAIACALTAGRVDLAEDLLRAELRAAEDSAAAVWWRSAMKGVFLDPPSTAPSAVQSPYEALLIGLACRCVDPTGARERAWMERAVRLRPSSTPIALEYARTVLRTGSASEARRALESVAQPSARLRLELEWSARTGTTPTARAGGPAKEAQPPIASLLWCITGTESDRNPTTARFIKWNDAEFFRGAKRQTLLSPGAHEASADIWREFLGSSWRRASAVFDETTAVDPIITCYVARSALELSSMGRARALLPQTRRGVRDLVLIHLYDPNNPRFDEYRLLAHAFAATGSRVNVDDVLAALFRSTDSAKHASVLRRTRAQLARRRGDPAGALKMLGDSAGGRNLPVSEGDKRERLWAELTLRRDRPVPTRVLSLTDGSTVRLADGRRTIVVLVEPGCAPCVQAARDLEKEQRERVVFLLRGAEEATAFAEGVSKFGVNVPCAIGQSEYDAWSRFLMMVGTPTFCVVSAKGTVLQVDSGPDGLEHLGLTADAR